MPEKIEVTKLPANRSLFSDTKIAHRLFQGEFFCIALQNKNWQNRMVQAVKKAFSPHCPTKAHLFLDNDDFIARLSELNESFKNGYQKELCNFSKNIGCSLKNIYWDKLILRAVPPASFFKKASIYDYIHPHRDTWGVNIYSQLNWWSPLFDLEENRTFQFFPDYWQKPIKNTTAEWSLKKYLSAKKQASTETQPPYPSAPECLTSPEKGNPALIEAGDWLIFSAAHLHGSIKNTSNKTRFNVEFRTVDKNHLWQKIEAPNVDNAATTKISAIFSNLKDRTRLKINENIFS